MPDGEDHWARRIRGLREGDSQVIQEFCDEYADGLQRLADRHLATGLRRRFEPEDVVQSAFRTFLRRAREGEFRLADSEALWRLLCAITLTKLREQARFHLREKRGLDQEVQADWASGPSGAGDRHPADPGPSPAEAAEFADQFQQLLASFDDEERQVVDLKLQEYTNEEAAEQMGCSERTVRRILKRVQTRLAQTLEVS